LNLNAAVIIIIKFVHAVHIQTERQMNRQIENEYKVFFVLLSFAKLS